MDICIPLRDPAPTNLRLGNLRSEPRCERAMLEAVANCDWVTGVYSLGNVWDGGATVAPKYRGLLQPAESKGVVLLMQDWWQHPQYPLFRFKGYVVNIFAGPWDSDTYDINLLSAAMGERFVFTTGYPSLFNDTQHKEGLKRFKPPSHLLPYPCIPESRYEPRFHKKTLLFPQRLLFMDDLNENFCVRWALSKLREDPGLNLRILSGFAPDNVMSNNGGKGHVVSTEINKYFWSLPKIAPFVDVRPRVRLEYGLDWETVLGIYSDTKLVIQADRHYGGPPLESAMYGIPFVGTMKNAGALTECPGYLFRTGEDAICGTLEQLLTDEGFYTKTALAYNKYAMDTYSYRAFTDNLKALLTTMGLF